MSKYHLVEHFDFLEGELEPYDRQSCFAFGVEWALFRQKLAGGAPFQTLVCQGNARRLISFAEREGRFIEAHPPQDGLIKLVVGNVDIDARP